jgi:hypothetical protein
MNLEGMPLCNRESIRFQRAEQAGHYLFTAWEIPDLFNLINSTAKEILDLCDGQRSVHALIEDMQRRYPGADPGLVQNDVLTTLFLFDRMGILGWSGTRPPTLPFTAPTVRLNGSVEVGRVSEDEFRALTDFLGQFGVTSTDPAVITPLYVWPMVGPFFFSPIYLRRRLFFFTEDYYCFKRQGEIRGLVSFLSNKPMLRSHTLGLILLLPDEEVRAVLGNLLNIAKLDLAKRSSKLSVHLRSDHPGKDVLASYLEAFHFTKEAELTDEFDLGVNDLIYGYRFAVNRLDGDNPTMKGGDNHVREPNHSDTGRV